MTATIAPANAPVAVRSRPPEEPSRPGAEPAATVALTLLTIVTAVGLCRLFPDWEYLRQMLVVVVGVHAALAVLRVVRAPVWVALPIGALLAFELLAIVYYRDTTRSLLPTGQTIDFIRADFRLVWRQFPSAVAPVPSEGSFAMGTAALLAACALLADTFAFRAFGRAEAIVPAGVVFVFTSALGTDRNRVTVSALWIGMAIVTIAILRFSHGREESAWMGTRRRSLAGVLPATLVCAGVAALAAGLLAPSLPGARSEPLLDTRNGGSDVTQVLNPLVDIRSRLVNRRNVEVFTVEAPVGQYWRVVGLDSFDGTTWSQSEESLRPATGELAQGTAGRTVEQTIRIKRLGGNLVPAAFAAVASETDGLYFADGSATLIKPGAGLRSNDVIQISSVVSDPTPEALSGATIDAPPSAGLLDLPGGFPKEVVDLAEEITAGSPTPYDKALALQDFFRNNFTYDLSVQSGHSDDAIRNFLRIRRGYCEQFAGTFAAMARAVGLPSRVAIGFTPGEAGADGLFHVYDRHAHAWPEVWFDGIGWISFEPTPGRGAPGAEQHTGVSAQQDTEIATTGGGGSGAGAFPDIAPVGTAPRIVADPNPATPTAVTPTTIASTGGSGGSAAGVGIVIAALIAAVVGWVVLMPPIARRWRSGRHHSAQDRVVAAWRRACGSLRLAGAPPVGGATPLEYARSVHSVTGVDAYVVGELARAVTRAVYGPRTVDEESAERSERLGHQIDELCAAQTPWSLWIRSRLDPRAARGSF